MPRTKNFDEDQALNSAELLFWERGYDSTSIQDLEEAMGLKRTSIYNAFGNKRALFKKALKRYINNDLIRFITVIQQASTAKQAIEGALNEAVTLHFTATHPGGCMIALSLLESYQHDDKTRAMAEEALKSLRQVLVQRFERAKDEGEFSSQSEYMIKADEVVAMILGIIVMAKAKVPKQRLIELSRSAVFQGFKLPD